MDLPDNITSQCGSLTMLWNCGVWSCRLCSQHNIAMRLTNYCMQPWTTWHDHFFTGHTKTENKLLNCNITTILKWSKIDMNTKEFKSCISFTTSRVNNYIFVFFFLFSRRVSSLTSFRFNNFHPQLIVTVGVIIQRFAKNIYLLLHANFLWIGTKKLSKIYPFIASSWSS